MIRWTGKNCRPKKIPEVTILRKNHQSLNITYAALIFFISERLIFNAYALSNREGWDNFYYICEKIKDCLFLWAITAWHDSLRKIVFPLLIYAILRLCFQIADIWIPTGPNTTLMVAVLFLAALVATIYLTIRQTTRECSGHQK